MLWFEVFLEHGLDDLQTDYDFFVMTTRVMDIIYLRYSKSETTFLFLLINGEYVDGRSRLTVHIPPRNTTRYTLISSTTP